MEVSGQNPKSKAISIVETNLRISNLTVDCEKGGLRG